MAALNSVGSWATKSRALARSNPCTLSAGSVSGYKRIFIHQRPASIHRARGPRVAHVPAWGRKRAVVVSARAGDAAAAAAANAVTNTGVAADAATAAAQEVISAGGTSFTGFCALDKLIALIFAKSASPYMNVMKAVFLASTLFLGGTILAVIMNKKTRERLWKEAGEPLKNNPVVWIRVKNALMWLFIVICANIMQGFTGQQILPLVWMALLISNVGGALKRSGATLKTAKEAVDKAAESGTTPDLSNLPGGKPITPQTPSFAAGQNETNFRARFPELAAETLMHSETCMLSEHMMGIPDPAAGRGASTSGQFYMTERYLTFHGVMSRKKVMVGVADIAKIERLQGGAFTGVRVYSLSGGCVDFTCAQFFGGGVDLYQLVKDRIAAVGGQFTTDVPPSTPPPPAAA
eukprot:CAMPEP_0118942402 /NCGR_PEP_ID=MMETSP1169-20130426/36088_1 /TAXON_ID=36882 /ORGANISM="Pyramimonas obovata, Strain CCMP722" /LENGTH=406 /DNA_ID=CAMNT_0006887413 /DNA_START=103 /DNA_END=1323 /DNA_ORIENTATION=-